MMISDLRRSRISAKPNFGEAEKTGKNTEPKKKIFFVGLYYSFVGLYYSFVGLYYSLAGLYYSLAGLYYSLAGLFYSLAGLLRANQNQLSVHTPYILTVGVILSHY